MSPTPWLTIIGIGEDGLAGLSPAALAIIENAQILVGGKRHLAFVPEDAMDATRLAWDTPMEKTYSVMAQNKDKRVVVLASGDPMDYGVGAALMRHFGIEEMTVLPAPGAFSLACARLGWSRPDVETMTLHGRPIALINGRLRPGARLILLSEDGKMPAQLARHLSERGFGESPMTVLEAMGGERENHIHATAQEWRQETCADLNTIAIECVAGQNAIILPRVPGLPDDAFLHDGQITKRIVRAATLCALAPLPGALLWDVGAGAGSVAIEWLRSEASAKAIAIEKNPERASRIAHNAEHLGVPHLEIVTGDAPQALADLSAPDVIFVGGGVWNPDILNACWEALTPLGRFVANSVTVESEAVLADFAKKHGGTLTRIAVSQATPAGAFHTWHAKHPVTQFCAVKAL